MFGGPSPEFARVSVQRNLVIDWQILIEKRIFAVYLIHSFSVKRTGLNYLKQLDFKLLLLRF